MISMINSTQHEKHSNRREKKKSHRKLKQLLSSQESQKSVAAKSKIRNESHPLFIGKEISLSHQFAISLTTPRKKGSRERDYGKRALQIAWRQVYQVIYSECRKVGLRVRLIERGFARNMGWLDKYKGATKDMKANEFRNRYAYQDRVEGMGRWHAHAAIEVDNELSGKVLQAIRKRVLKRLESKSNRVFDMRMIFDLQGWLNYIRKNVATTVRTGFEHLRTTAKTVQQIVKAEMNNLIDTVTVILRMIPKSWSSIFRISEIQDKGGIITESKYYDCYILRDTLFVKRGISLCQEASNNVQQLLSDLQSSKRNTKP